VANTDHGSGRFSAAAIGGGTSRTLLVTGDPDTVISAALAAGASVTWRPGGRGRLSYPRVEYLFKQATAAHDPHEQGWTLPH